MKWLRYIGGILLGSVGLYVLTSLVYFEAIIDRSYKEWHSYLYLIVIAVVGIACIWQACRLFRKPKRKVRRVSHEND